MENAPRLRVVFFKTDLGKEPVRNWLKRLPKEERRLIGEDIKTVQFGWPIGMSLVRPLHKKLWEIRTDLATRISRVFFTTYKHQIVLLHGTIKKDQKIRESDLALAKKRLAKFKKEEDVKSDET